MQSAQDRSRPAPRGDFRIPPDAAALLREFGHTFSAKAMANPRKAFNRCATMSQSFADFLALRGVGSSVLRAVGYSGGLDRAAPPWRTLPHAQTVVHYVVLLPDGRTVDWTARQFDPEADVPRILDEADFRREWTSVEVHALHPRTKEPA